VIAWLERHDRIESADAQPWYDRLIELWDQLGAEMVSAAAGLGV